MVTVNYWRGTMRLTGTANTYRGAMRIASRNENSFGPRFYEGDRELIDDGHGLAYLDEVERESGPVVVRKYAV